MQGRGKGLSENRGDSRKRNSSLEAVKPKSDREKQTDRVVWGKHFTSHLIHAEKAKG